MPTLETIDRDLKIVRKRIDLLLEKKPKETWVGVAVVTDLTGWQGREKLRWARENGLVVFDRQKGYLLESIPEVYITKNKPMQTYYETWQNEKYGNVLPESLGLTEVFEHNADQDSPVLPEVTGEVPESKFDNQ